MTTAAPIRILPLVLALLFSWAGPTQADNTPTGRATGLVYVVHAVDTECRFLVRNYHQTERSIDTSNFFPPGNVDRAMGREFRDANRDSFGKSIRYSWFLMISEIYFHTPKDPGLVYRFMDRFAERAEHYGDIYGLHYHHADFNDYNDDTDSSWCQLLSLDSSRSLHGTDIELAEKMIAYLLLEHEFYPVLCRAGWTWEDTDLSNWLDDIVPFDFTNAAPAVREATGDDGFSSVYDWSRAPADWSWYHPAADDYQTAGDSKRAMFRCAVSTDDFEAAFRQAAGGDTLMIAYYVHSFTPLQKYPTTDTLAALAAAYPSVRFRFVNALEGARLMLGLEDTRPPVTGLLRQGDRVTVLADEPLFAFPFGAIVTGDGEYRRVRPMREAPELLSGTYRWTFDLSGLDYVEFIAGGTDPAGNAFVTGRLRPDASPTDRP